MNKYINADLLKEEIESESVPEQMKNYVLDLIDRQEPVDFFATLKDMISKQRYTVTVMKKGTFGYSQIEGVTAMEYMPDSNKWRIETIAEVFYVDNDNVEEISRKVEVTE